VLSETVSDRCCKYHFQEKPEQMDCEKGYAMMDDAWRGYRITVLSPVQTGLVEAEAIKHLVKNGFITICSGGGGIPVIGENGRTKGVEAVRCSQR
jgi:carbamate kinase